MSSNDGDGDDDVIVVPYDLPEAKRIQYAKLERRHRAKLRALAGYLATQRGSGALTPLASDRLSELMAEAQRLVNDWDPTTPGQSVRRLSELEILVADCRELNDQMSDLVEYVIGLQQRWRRMMAEARRLLMDLGISTIDVASLGLEGVAPVRSAIEDVVGPTRSGRSFCNPICNPTSEHYQV